MGSPPTLDPGPSRPPDPHRQAVTGDGEHLQTPAAIGGHEFGNWPIAQIANGFGGDLDARHPYDHTRPDRSRDPTRDAERTFDRLNPDYGVPADERSTFGRQAVHDREAALALGIRVAIHDSRQNDRKPVIWQPGQDYRMADAILAARYQPTCIRYGPERVGPER